MRQVPEYYKYLTWYDLYTPLGLYNFMQELKDNNIDLNKYPDIKVYYELLCSSAFKNEPNMITVDYVVKKLRCALIRYNFAHTTDLVDRRLFYYWFYNEEV